MMYTEDQVRAMLAEAWERAYRLGRSHGQLLAVLAGNTDAEATTKADVMLLPSADPAGGEG